MESVRRLFASAGFSGIMRNLGWLLAGRGVTAVLSILYLAIATRTLGIVGFGRFAIIVGAVQMLTTFVGFQTWEIIVRYGTKHVADGDADKLARLYRACALLDLASAVLGALLSAAILWVWGEALGIGPTLWRATMIYTAVALLSIRSTPLGMLRLHDRFSLGTLADSIQPAARLIGAAVAATLHATLQGFLVAWMVAELLTAIGYWLTVRRTGDLALMWRCGGGAERVFADNPGIAGFALTTNANSTLYLSSKQLPLLLVGGTAGTAAAGIYRLAAQLAQSLTKVSQLLTRAAFPEIVKSVTSGKLRQVGRLLARSVLVVGGMALVAFLIALAAGRPALWLIGGEQYTAGYAVLMWLAAAGCVDLATTGFEPVLMAANRASRAFAVRLVATAVMLAASFALAPVFGPIGIAQAVLAYSIAMALLLGLMLARAVREDAAASRP